MCEVGRVCRAGFHAVAGAGELSISFHLSNTQAERLSPMTHVSPHRLALLLIVFASLFGSVVLPERASAQRRRRGTAAVKKPHVRKAADAPAPKLEPYDLSVEVVTGRILFTDLTTPMLMVTNRDRRPVTIRKVKVNDDWDVQNPVRHSTLGILKLPVELKLGDKIEWAVYPPYKKEVVYVELDTDVGVLTFKVGRQKE